MSIINTLMNLKIPIQMDQNQTYLTESIKTRAPHSKYSTKMMMMMMTNGNTFGSRSGITFEFRSNFTMAIQNRFVVFLLKELNP